MKIVCDACQAKYSISDDKVQGKVFKIRCKKCSNIIVVRGGAGATEAPAPVQDKDTRVYDYGYEGGDQAPGGDEQVWHVVINQDQVGPMTVAEVHQRFSAGEIDAESYIWREGFADWLPLSQVDVFASLASAAPAGGGQDAVSSMFGGGASHDDTGTSRSDPGDLFAAAAGGRGDEADDGGGDLFAAKPSGGHAKDAANAKMRGERNENSVLFSLNNLAQLASDKPAPMMSSPSSGAATGQAGGEGSGLIDIRSMANAYLGSSGGAQAKTSTAIGSIDDLPVFGGGGFSEPAVIVPTARPSNNNRLMYALIGSVGLLAVVAVIMIVVLMRGGNKNPVVATNDKPVGSDGTQDTPKGSDNANTPPAPDKAQPDTAVKAPDTAKTPDTTAKAPDTAVKAPDTTAKAPDTAVKAPDTTHKTPTPPPPHKTPTNNAVTVAHDPKPPHDTVAVKDPKPPAPDKTKPDKPDTSGGGCDEVSCVLNNYEGACCAKFKKGGGKGTPTTATPDAGKPHSDLPDSLDRTMISDGVGKVKARVMACGDKSPAKGQVKVSVKVSADGHVAGVTVKNTPDPALGNCVAAAMQRATFAKTQNGGSFGYPFVF